jgi:hypothetical protein
MDASVLVLLGLGMTAVVAVSVAGYLRPPLRQLLAEQNGGQRVRFWTAYFGVVVVLVPLVFAMLSQPEPGMRMPATLAVAQQVRWGLLGLALSLLVAGRVLRRKTPHSTGPLAPTQSAVPGPR